MDTPGQRFAGALRGFVALADRHAKAVALLAVLLSLVAGAVAVQKIGLEGDNEQLLAESLPFQQRWRAFGEAFPTLNRSLIVVLDGDSAGALREAAEELEAKLQTRPDLFARVWTPGSGEFFEKHGLLYSSADELEAFGDRLASLQPVLSELTLDPTLPTLCRVIRNGLEYAGPDAASADELVGVLDEFGDAALAVYVERPVSVSWESMLLSGSALDPATRVVLIADAILDFDAILKATGPIDAVREAGRALDLESRGITLRITGYPALNHEEILGMVWDVLIAGGLSFLLVLLVLWLALRSKRLVTAAALTLLTGLIWTTGLASVLVGDLNLVSLAFAIFVIGLGVDFGIHLCMHYATERRRGLDHSAAIDEAVRLVGPALALCTLTTAIGFFAFAPTDYRGVAELGLISGTGMLVILLLTLTLLPALLRLMCESTPLPDAHPPARLEHAAASLVERRAGRVLLIALCLGVVAAVLATRVRLDSNVVEMRNPNSESVQAFHDLLQESGMSPWYVDAVAPDLPTAQQRAREFEQLPEVESAASLLDYVPADQDEKIMILEEAAYLLETPGRRQEASPPTPAEQLEALRQLAETLDVAWVAEARTPLARSAGLLRKRLLATLARLDGDPDHAAALADLEQGLLGRVPERLAGLRVALATGPVGLEDLPEDLSGRMVAADGRARIQVFPEADLREESALDAFVAAVRTIDPEATGLPVNLIDTGRAVADSLRQALSWALGAILLLLLVLWRRPLDAVFALGPLVLAGIVTVGVMATVGLPFNFINVIVLPLLLGIGVDSGIHLVTRARRPLRGDERLVDTVTARAVLWSALTTLISFSTLALSGHRGLSSLGQLLALGMAMTLVSMLVVLPALLARLGRLLHEPARE